jgi:hypothetical protein
MRQLIIAGMLALLAGCAVKGNPNQVVRTPYYVEPEAASLDLNFLPLSLRAPACPSRRHCDAARRGNAGPP